MKIYEQICLDIKDGIVSKKFKAGERLPSLLAMSKEYNCSKGTVLKAYEELRSQHVIYSKPQSGYYMADNLMREEDYREGLHLDDGNPVVGSFSTMDTHHCLHIAADMYSTYSLNISIRGTPSLNSILHKFLAMEDVHAKSENIYLTQGITQIMTHLTHSPFPNGKKTILVESPSSQHYITYLKQTDARVLTIKRDENGLDLKQLEAYFKNEDIKFFYVIPRNHNPLGTKLSNHQRRHIMELALKYDVYIVEDDYFGSAHKLPKYVPIYYFSNQKNCIHLRSMSKVLPLLRIGIALIPKEFHSTFEELAHEAYYYSYFMPSLISQAAYEVYLKTGIYEKHYAQITSLISKKLRIVKETVSGWDPRYVTLIGAESGYYFSLRLHPDINVNVLISKLQKKQIFITSTQGAFYFKEHYDNSVRLAISKITAEHLIVALDAIYETILSMMDNIES